MKKRIALFANGWNSGNLYPVINGILQVLPHESADIFTFMSHNTYVMSKDEIASECTVFRLPDLSEFDCAVIFTSGLNSNKYQEELVVSCKNAGIPTISIGESYDSFGSILISNESGMNELMEHLSSKHNVKSIKFIAGSRDNSDSNARLGAVRKFMSSHGYKFDDNDIFYSDWERDDTMCFARDNFKTKESLPDAFVCANDQLAISVCMGLRRNNLKVPEDVLVTGFDFLPVGKAYYPSIACVSQNYEKVGELCADMIIDVLANGASKLSSVTVNSSYLPGESCGCFDVRNDDILRREFSRISTEENFEFVNLECRVKSTEAAVLDSESLDNLSESLSNIYLSGNAAEGDSFHVLMDPNFETIVSGETSFYENFSFSPEMRVIVSKEAGITTKIEYISRKDLIPGYTGEGDNHVYFFTPLYILSYVCGYIVTRDQLFYLPSGMISEINNCFLKTLPHFKKNIQFVALNNKLSRLMETDGLTSLKNRIAFEDAKKKLQNQLNKGNFQPFAAVMFDLNNLKEINDTEGHDAGDDYIRSASRRICKTFAHSPVYRIGGDEFACIIQNDDFLIRNELLQMFRENAVIPSPIGDLSIASGLADFDFTVDKDIESVFSRADDEMYLNKRSIKKI